MSTTSAKAKGIFDKARRKSAIMHNPNLFRNVCDLSIIDRYANDLENAKNRDSAIFIYNRIMNGLIAGGSSIEDASALIYSINRYKSVRYGIEIDSWLTSKIDSIINPAQPTHQPKQPAQQPQPTHQPKQPAQQPQPAQPQQPTQQPQSAQPQQPAQPTKQPVQPVQPTQQPTQQPAQPTKQPAQSQPVQPTQQPEPVQPTQQPAQLQPVQQQAQVEKRLGFDIRNFINNPKPTGLVINNISKFQQPVQQSQPIQQQAQPTQQPKQQPVQPTQQPTQQPAQPTQQPAQQPAQKSVYDSNPDMSIEDKISLLKKHIKFIDGLHEGNNGISINALNALINNFINQKSSSYFKHKIKELGSKANNGSVFMTEVPVDKYGNGDARFDTAFTIPTKNKKNPIIVLYEMEPKWNNTTNSYNNNIEIKLANSK